MDGHFIVEADPARSLIKISLSGLFGREQVAAFREARNREHARLACGPNRHVTLTDVRDIKIQPQDTVAAFHELLDDPVHRSRRLAFVTSNTLARQQLMRALAGREARCFE